MADDSDEFSDSEFNMESKLGGGQGKSTVVQNQPYDEVEELGSSGSLDESVDTNEASSPPPRSPAADESRGDSPPQAHDMGKAEYAGDDNVEIPGQDTRIGGSMTGGDESSSSSGEDEDEDDEDGGDAAAAAKRGGYNPNDYAHLDVSAEIRELFGYIGRYKPHNIELDTKIKCFIPDYIPAVGEIDAFIKVARPDGKADDLGLKVLDEPAARQSDPTLLDLMWRRLIKKPVLEPVRVASIDNADKNPKEIQRWIDSVNDLHRTQPRPHVQYKKSMPDIEMLMQEWPPEFEKRLKEVKLPTADINMSLKDYAATVCAIMDIPVYDSIIPSLHVLFTLFSEFKTNAHFMNLQAASNNAPPAAGAGAGAGAGSTAETMTF